MNLQEKLVTRFFFGFAGCKECQILSNIEETVDDSLPDSKLRTHFEGHEAAKLYILNKIAFCEAWQKVICLFYRTEPLFERKRPIVIP